MSQNSNDLLNVKPVWNQTAIDYHKFTRARDSYSLQIERPAIEAIVSNLEFQNVLDLGCGTGHYALWFARRGAQVTGIDLSAEMLSIARAEAAATGLAIELREGDIRKRLPFDDCAFDLIFSATALHYIEDLAELFHEAYRVLRENGNLLISALHPASTGLFPTIEQDYQDEGAWNLKYFNRARRRIFAPWSQARPGSSDAPPDIECYHHRLEDYLNAIISTGFVLRTVREPYPTESLAADNPARFAYSSSQPLSLLLHAQRS